MVVARASGEQHASTCSPVLSNLAGTLETQVNSQTTSKP